MIIMQYSSGNTAIFTYKVRWITLWIIHRILYLSSFNNVLTELSLVIPKGMRTLGTACAADCKC